jgi:hypothetical protein
VEKTLPPMTPASTAKGSDSLFYNLSASPDLSCNTQHQFIHDRMSRKFVPYPP